MGKRSIILILLLVFSYPAIATQKSLMEYRKNVLEVGAKLKKLEKDIGSKNAHYLLKLEEATAVEKQMLEAENINITLENKYKLEEKKYKKILRSLALSSVEDEVVPQKQYRLMIEKKKEEVLQALFQLNKITQILTQEKVKLDQIKKESQDIANFLLDLDQKKKNLMNQYVNHVDSRNNLENKIQTQKLSTKLAALKKVSVDEQKASKIFNSPLANFVNFIPSEKGVTFQFEESQPLKASLGGRILYFGELSSYGKVLMIDHGDGLRSVMLGYFDSTLKKDDVVKKGQILGFIRAEKSPSSLYFEVRKGNAAQKTIYWLDEVTLSKI